jgi:hypothetical protein
MIKVFVGVTELSNVIFTPCMWLFIIGAPIWEMSVITGGANEGCGESGDGKKLNTTIWDKIINNMPYIYAPFILLEIYSMGSRILQYGLTVERYAAVMFIIFQIVYVAWNVMCGHIVRTDIDKNDVHKNGLKNAILNKSGLVIAVIILLFIALVIPVVNVEYACFASQRKRFDKSYKEAQKVLEGYQDYAEISQELTDDEVAALKQFIGSYDYLDSDARGRRYVKANVKKSQISSDISLANEILRNLNEENSYGYDESWDYLRFNRYNELKSIDISGGYNTAYVISLSDSDERDRAYYEEYEISGNDDNYAYSATVDLTPLIDALELEYDGEYSGLPTDEPYEIIIDLNTKLVITGFTISKLSGGNTYKWLDMSGYLLVR